MRESELTLLGGLILLPLPRPEIIFTLYSSSKYVSRTIFQHNVAPDAWVSIYVGRLVGLCCYEARGLSIITAKYEV